MKSILTVIAICAGLVLVAQPENPGPPAPIDGGVLLLAAAGAIYGAKKTKDYLKG